MQDIRGEETFEPAAVFSFLAETLGDIAGRIARVEEHAADMVGGSSPDARRMIVLQDLDVLRQTIEDAARVADAARAPGTSRTKQLAASVRLEAVRNRLLDGIAARDRPPEDRNRDVAEHEGFGRVEFFGRTDTPF